MPVTLPEQRYLAEAWTHLHQSAAADVAAAAAVLRKTIVAVAILAHADHLQSWS